MRAKSHVSHFPKLGGVDIYDCQIDLWALLIKVGELFFPLLCLVDTNTFRRLSLGQRFLQKYTSLEINIVFFDLGRFGPFLFLKS